MANIYYNVFIIYKNLSLPTYHDYSYKPHKTNRFLHCHPQHLDSSTVKS
jgi:hypothetical protein